MQENSAEILAYSVPEAARRMSLSVATTWRRIGDGSLRSIMIGKRRLVPADAIREILSGEGE